MKKKLKKKIDLKTLKFVSECYERVEKGAKYLDKFSPNWYLDTSMDDLNLSNRNTCMLGQAFGDFWSKIIDDAGFATKRTKGALTTAQAVSRGFMLPEIQVNTFNGAYDILTALWLEKITQMRLLNKYGFKVCSH